jgi:2-polyprenyl-6-methoxyphenol hydroxylase-like FAD-dependent oxidoreductase
MTVHKTPSILISGASIAGLTTAYWLDAHGFDVTVVERAAHLRPGGQALDIRGPALEIAARMGVLERFQESITHLTGVSAVNSEGEEIYRDTERTLTGGLLNSSDLEVLRDDICKILYEAVLDRVTFLFADQIAAINQVDDAVEVSFARGQTRKFDLVVGADGLHSGVRRLVFGPEKDYLRQLGTSYVATFGMPNFLGLDRWEVIYQNEDMDVGAMVMGLRKEADARAYVGFKAENPLDYDYRDIAAQKRLVADRIVEGGWVLPQIVEHMMSAPDFHFDSISQIRMDGWSRGRVVLVGDAGYSVALATGQGTTVAMVGAYVLAGELATHRHDLTAGLAAYETSIRDYVLRNQDDAVSINSEPANSDEEAETGSDAKHSYPDFGAMTHPFDIKDYANPAVLPT